MKYLLAICFYLMGSAVMGQVLADWEFGLAFTGRNVIQVSGTSGTRFNVLDELGTEPRFDIRLRGGYRFKNRHNVFALIAPLKLKYEGSFDTPISFDGQVFDPILATNLEYRFNSYRLTYRYDFVANDRWRIGAGLTGKIRDAFVLVEQETIGKRARFSNVGFVPLINLYVRWHASEKVSFLAEGDGLTASQGRAFDYQFALDYYWRKEWSVRVAYRFLEGGADNDEIYNFSFIHYAQVGGSFNF